MIREELANFLEDKEVETFQDGRYKDEVREVYYKLLSKGVSATNVESIIQTVLKKFANKKIGRLPKKSVACNMMAECDQLAKMQVGKAILEGTNNTLHLDGTCKHFNEYCSFQVTTDGGSQGLSMGFEDMPSGSADDYLSATKDLFTELAQLLLPKDSTAADIEQKEGQLLSAFKNVQSDHNIVNKNYFEQLQMYRASFLPKLLPNFHQLSADEVSNVLQMNQLFCGMHAIIGLGTVCKEALKEFETVAASVLTTSGFNKGNAQSYDILWDR